MHIEEGMVDISKIGLSYATAGFSGLLIIKASVDYLKENSVISFILKMVLSTLAVFMFFEVFPHHSVGVSEVHLIMGSTLFLLFGLAPAAIGLCLGLLAQGLLFAPFDLPQYGMNVTTLIIPLMLMAWLASKIISPNMAYKDLSYNQVLKLSCFYQGGIISWVAFWVFYGQGFGSEVFTSVASFSLAYTSVILIEPLLDLAVLAFAKYFSSLEKTALIEKRVYNSQIG